MEFPVYVASDCYGEKINVALRYNPRGDTLGDLYTSAETAFALFTIQHLHEAPPQPFAFAYLYNDALCQWDILESAEQLSACCQVYVFRCGGEESVDAIPEPINLAAALHHSDSAAPHRSFPRNAPSASPSPLRLIGERWALPAEPRARDSSRGYEFPASAAMTAEPSALAEDYLDQQFVSDSTQHQASRQAQAARFRSVSNFQTSDYGLHHAADVSTASFGAVHSHRFRLQLLSPPPDPDVVASTSRPRFGNAPEKFAVSPPRLSPRGSAFNDAHAAIHSPTRSEEPEIPRSWFKRGGGASLTSTTALAGAAGASPPRADHRNASLLYSSPSSISRRGSSSRYDREHRNPPSLSRSFASTPIAAPSRRSSFPRVVLSAPPPPPLLSPAATSTPAPVGTPPLHPTSFGTTTRPRRGSSILREERERVEERMHMDVDALRVNLQEEVRGYERSRSTSQRYRR